MTDDRFTTDDDTFVLPEGEYWWLPDDVDALEAWLIAQEDAALERARKEAPS